MPENEWDPQDNTNRPPTPEAPSLTTTTPGSDQYYTIAPPSGVWTTTSQWTAVDPGPGHGLHATADNNTFDSGTLWMRQMQMVLGTSPSHPMQIQSHVTPIEFRYHLASWRYVLALSFSLLLAPFMIILSKLLNRATGFTVRNS